MGILFPENIYCISCDEPISDSNKLSLCKNCYDNIEFLYVKNTVFDKEVMDLLKNDYISGVHITTIYNDIMQGKAKHLGVIMCGTPQCVEDTRRGIFSYEALRSRLESSRFADGNTRDLLSPIIRLKPLTPEELYFLICKLEKIHAQVYKYETKLSSETLQYFIKTELGRVGAGQNITPREIIRDFIEILNILIQNPDKTLEGILGGDDFNYAKSSEDTEEIKS